MATSLGKTVPRMTLTELAVAVLLGRGTDDEQKRFKTEIRLRQRDDYLALRRELLAVEAEIEEAADYDHERHERLAALVDRMFDMHDEEETCQTSS